MSKHTSRFHFAVCPVPLAARRLHAMRNRAGKQYKHRQCGEKQNTENRGARSPA